MHVQVRGEFINNFKGSVFWVQPPAPLPRHIPILWVLLILGPKVESQFAPICCILPTTAHIFATKVWEDKKEKKVNGHFPHSLRTPAPWTVRKTSFLESYALAHIVAHLLLLPQDHLGFRIQKNRNKEEKEKKKLVTFLTFSEHENISFLLFKLDKWIFPGALSLCIDYLFQISGCIEFRLGDTREK